MLVQQICAIYRYNCNKNGKGVKIGTKEVDTIWIDILSGHFKRLNILEIFQDNYSAYRDLTIKSKFLQNIFFAVLLVHNVNPTAEKSSKN